MVKTPKTRHYKSTRAPVTIDLEATPADEPASQVKTPPVDTAATDLERAEAPAQAGGFEPWLDPRDASVPGAEVAEEKFDEAVASDSSRTADGDDSDKVAGADKTVFEHSKPAPADIGDSQPAASSFGRSNMENTSTASETAYVPPTPPRKSDGGLSRLLAGVIGGVIALLGAGGLQFAGLLGAPGGGQADTPALSALQSEIGALRAEIETLNSAGGGDSGAAVASLSTSVDQLKAEIATLQSAVQAGGSGDNAAVGALDAKVKELEAALGQLSQASGGASQEEVAALSTKLAGVEQSVAALTSKLDAQAAQPKIALAISAAALKSALDRGSPFSAELETFAAISPSAPEIAPLRRYAETGVMTRADIAKAFPDAANAMVAASEPADQDAGFFQRLLSSAESVVKVRPIGEVPGEDPPARVARMEVAVNAGDYEKALAEFAALPVPVQAAGSTLVDKIRARVEVEKLVDQMITGAMKPA